MMFIESTGGAKTPQDIAKAVRKYGVCIAVKDDPFLNGKRYYYTVEDFDEDRILEVTYIEGIAVATTWLPPTAKKLLQRDPIDVMEHQLKFGGF